MGSAGGTSRRVGMYTWQKGGGENRPRGRRTWVSLRGVHLVCVIGLYRPIAAQEELPAQWGEEPAYAVGDWLGVRLVGHTLCAA